MQRSFGPVAALGGTLLFIGFLIPAEHADAHTRRVPTSIEVEKARTPPSVRTNYCNPPCVLVSVLGPGYEIRGTLDSSVAHCLAHRRVALYRSDRRRRIVDGVTDAEGGFRFDLGSDYARGEWYVRSFALHIQDDEHKHVCEAAESEPVTVP